MTGLVARIPYGTMHVDARGRVIDHEDPAHKSLVRRDLFRVLAPRHEVERLRESLRAFLAGGEDAARAEAALENSVLDRRRVSVLFGRICGETAIVRIRPL